MLLVFIFILKYIYVYCWLHLIYFHCIDDQRLKYSVFICSNNFFLEIWCSLISMRVLVMNSNRNNDISSRDMILIIYFSNDRMNFHILGTLYDVWFCHEKYMKKNRGNSRNSEFNLSIQTDKHWKRENFCLSFLCKNYQTHQNHENWTKLKWMTFDFC